ncbi:hypothetical protein B0H14DRAFT_2596931 [Mycena olivaceomarginata]|nr:hypothetical protein B0H14DRAFT_2596931 [Mycena olivaceomarginata]
MKLTIPFKEHWEQGHTATEYSRQAALEGALAQPLTNPPMKEHLFSATDQHHVVNGSWGTHTYRHEVPLVRNEDPVHPKQSHFGELQTTAVRRGLETPAQGKQHSQVLQPVHNAHWTNPVPPPPSRTERQHPEVEQEPAPIPIQ